MKLSLSIIVAGCLATASFGAILPGNHDISKTPEPGARIESNSIIDIEPTNGSIWFGTGRGLAQLHLDGSGWATINESDGLGRGGVSALEVTDSTIWAATAYTEEVRGDFFPAGGGVGYSRDGGATWKWMRQPVDSIGETNYSPTTTNIQNVTYDIALTDSAAWIVSWGGGLRRMKYGSDKWDLFTVDGNTFSPLLHLAHRGFSAAYDGNFLWVGTAAGIHRTSDEGATWMTFSHVNGNPSTLSGNFVTAIGVQKIPTKSLVWAATWRADAVNEYYGVTVTDDGGANWRVVLSDSTILHMPDGDFYLIDAYGPLRVHNFGFSDSTVYACADEVLWQSNDLGLTWSERANDQLQIKDPTTGEALNSPDYFSAAGVGDSLWVGSDDGLAVGWYDNAVYNWRLHRAFQAPGVNGVPDSYAYPNPFSPARGQGVRFQFPLTGSDQVNFEVRNFAMEPVYKSRSTPLPGGGTGDMAGYGAVIWDGKTDQGKSVANGIYFYMVKAQGKEYWGKVMVID